MCKELDCRMCTECYTHYYEKPHEEQLMCSACVKWHQERAKNEII